MSISKSTAQSPIDIFSSLTRPSSIDSNILEDPALLMGNAGDSLSLWCSILDTYGKEILKCASHHFLDLAAAMRLDAISTTDLVCLLSKAGRLGYTEANMAEARKPDPLPYEACEGLNASFASTLPGESDFTAAPPPSPVEASRERKRRMIDENGSRGVDGLPRAEISLTTGIRYAFNPGQKITSRLLRHLENGIPWRRYRLLNA